ncbi:glycosyltransferase [uncultured Draconibacterium sp.]|uniref:glycosyltransferase n=1 Tax=uncultured Draconibacterium sp. TaxID=1573823 RepID=UPI0032169268
MNSSEVLSIILLSYYSSERIYQVHSKVTEIMEEEKIPFELIIIDDGSEDNSFDCAIKLVKRDKRVRAYQLSRNFTSHYARFAGLSKCSGACATFIPDDFQMPLETVVKMYRLWQKDNKIIVPFRAYRKDGKISDFFSNAYYNIMNRISDVEFPKGGADGMLIDREIINILNNRIRPRNTSTIVEVLRMGFDPVFIPYKRPSVDSESRWTMKKKLKLATDTILSSSSFPIKMITVLGLSSVVISFMFILFIFIIKLNVDDSFLGLSVPGWASSFVLISFFSGLILFSLGIIAEYIWRIHEEVKDRPGFIIRNRDDKEN